MLLSLVRMVQKGDPAFDGTYRRRPSEATQLTKTGFTGRAVGSQRFVVDWMTGTGHLGWRWMGLLELSLADGCMKTRKS
jgi:hypothetical protein